MFGKAVTLCTILALLTFTFIYYEDEIQRAADRNPVISSLFRYSSETEQEGKFIDRPEVIKLFVTVQGNDPLYGLDFQSMNRLDIEGYEGEDPALPITASVGTPAPAASGSQEPDADAAGTIEQRGNTVRNAPLKSFKIKLDAPWPIWNNQEVINLNKHPYDLLRIRNKLSFDLLKQVPNITSLQTRFVQLFVKDLSGDAKETGYTDYGLFTEIEETDQDFLKRSGLDPEGYLYRAVNFEFNRYPEQLKNRNDPTYDKSAFETVLRVEGREYHDKLLSMLDDVNNDELNFSAVFNKYFDKDNFLTWMAVNLVMGNLDTSSQNFYLYSSRFFDKWYFLPWDYDGAWGFYTQFGKENRSLHPSREGISLYWAWPITRRFFQEKNNVEALSEKVEEVAAYLSKEQVQNRLDQYYPLVQPFVLRQPDLSALTEANVPRYREQFMSLADIPAANVTKYYESLEKPMPIFIGGPWFEDGKMTFTWWESFDLQGDEIFYDFQISRDPAFLDVVYRSEGLQVTEWVLDALPPAPYYWRVTVRDAAGNRQPAYGTYVDAEGEVFHGIQPFVIE